MINRREFFGITVGAGATLALTPELLRVRTLVMREMHQIMKDIDVVVSPTNRRASLSSATTLVIHA